MWVSEENMKKPYYTDGKQTIINGDCLEYMKTLSDKSFDLVLTDPPYGVGYEYDIWEDTEKNLKNLLDKIMPEILRVGKAGKDYSKSLRKVFKEIQRELYLIK